MAKFQLALLISNGDSYLEDVFTSFNYDLDNSLNVLSKWEDTYDLDKYMSNYNKTVKIIMDYCKTHDIGTIVVGYSKTIRKSDLYEKEYYDKFMRLSMREFKSKLEHKCKIYDIDFIKQEESYTSKSDFLAGDILPSINVENLKTYEFKGERISRGQYKSSTNTILNADINASLNILKKSKMININNLMKIDIKQPKRIKVSW